VPVLLLLLVAMTLEITVLVMVGDAIGVLPTILLLVAASIAGIALLRREGARTMTAFTSSVRDRRIPYREVTDGVLIAVAGVFVLVPGFISDVVALLLLFPPTRALIRLGIQRRALRRAKSGQPMVVDAEFVVRPDQDPRIAPTILLPGDDTRR
jgi:UPF0716 protein FxsA